MGEDASLKNDEEIVKLVQSGKIEFFSLLVDRYENKIKRYGKNFISNKEDINDIIQEVFIKAYKNIQSFDVNRKFSSWLYRIAHNEMVNALRKKKFLPLMFFDLDILFPHSCYNNIDNHIDQKDMKKMIDGCLDKLEPKYREPVALHYLEGLSYKEISDIMQIPISTVGVRIKRAKNTMKSILKKIGYNL
ncbi:MAG: RNA polymerase sigma factor [Candidatus Pacebacteria bacterium]|nr:RNA polymerase sigma factor [Candidatus Paceibacterota bacterium]